MPKSTIGGGGVTLSVVRQYRFRVTRISVLRGGGVSTKIATDIRRVSRHCRKKFTKSEFKGQGHVK